jgi:hypothetical protein
MDRGLAERVRADREEASVQALDFAGNAVTVPQVNDIDVLRGQGLAQEEHEAQRDRPRPKIRNFGAAPSGRRAPSTISASADQRSANMT